ncbi:MAG TPA: protein kinase, partial [Actinomycetota bacterium]|nr:protein kinase [Actinomycetota bacterium]
MTHPLDRSVAGLIGDRYELEGLIASGGMGSVYRARDTVLDRTVALKVLHETGSDPSFVERFRAEATNAARLSHPNIVAVYDFGYADGRPFMAMEYVDGQTLRDILTSKRVVKPELASSIAASVASALE